MTAVWAWTAAVGAVAVGVLVGRLWLRRIERRHRLDLLAYWAPTDDDYAVAYLEQLYLLPARQPQHHR